MAQTNKKLPLYLPVVIAISIIIGIFLGLKFTGEPQTSEKLFIYPKKDKLSNLLNLIEEEYVDPVSTDTIVEEVIPDLLKRLDPHSVYFPADAFSEVQEEMTGHFGGIGVQFNMTEDTVTIINTIPGGPSEKLGILAGDRIVTINDSLVAGQGIINTDIVKLLKGEIGTSVNVGIKRRGNEELIDYTIVRGEIPIHSVDVSYMINEDIGYIKIIRFSRTTFQEFVDAVMKLEKESGLSKVIIDLRGNTGGYMDAATNIANQFLDAQKLIVYTEGKARPRHNVYSNKSGICLNMDVAVILDEFSASASEILAGALQDNDRGLIIGRRSFGKGLVQTETSFGDGSAVRITIARYYTPSGRSIQKPYSSGDDEDYFMDIHKRFANGEFEEKDSIHFDDSLVFKTVGGRTVYGGGGIMPDIFIPIDTSGISAYYNRVNNLGLTYRFAFNYTDKHRSDLNELGNAYDIRDYLIKNTVFDKFVNFAKDNGVKPNWEQINYSRKILETQVYALIARNVIDNDGFYPIIKDIDMTLIRTIEELEKDNLELAIFSNQ